MNFAVILGVLSALVLPEAIGAPVDDDKGNVVLVHALFRHGNRTPDKPVYPNDPYANETYAPIGWSQLTPKGKHTEYEIGRFLRETYGQLIPIQYTPDAVYAISTNFKRTKMSLELVLSGLFPPLVTDDFGANLNWQPLPFNIETSTGLIGVASAYCANYISGYFTYVLSKEAQDICAQYKPLYDTLSKYSGSDVRNPRGAAGIYFALKSEEDYGLQLPDWTVGLYPDIIEEAAAVDYEFSTSSATLKKLSAGFLIKKILEDTRAKQNGSLPAERKIFLYSAHEYNVATTLRTLNVFWRHVPPFGATIIFEIHDTDGVYGLKLYYLDYKQEGPKVLTIPGCDTICPIDQVYNLIQDYLPGPNDVCEYSTELM